MLPRTGCCFWPGTIDLKIDSPISTQELPIREVRQFEEKVRNIIIDQKQRGIDTLTEMPEVPLMR